MAKAKMGRGGGAAKGKGPVDTRKPKHSNDASRPSKGGTTLRDAATVSDALLCCLHSPHAACLSKELLVPPPKPCRSGGSICTRSGPYGTRKESSYLR